MWAPRSPGGLYGIGFARRNPASHPAFTRDFVIGLLAAFQARQTGNQAFPRLDASVHRFNVVALPRKKVLFESLEHLANCLDLDVLWQPSCRLIYRRTHTPATHSHSGWRLVTMFPDDGDASWASSPLLTDDMKQRLHAAGFNRNVHDLPWTGRIGSHDGAVKQTHPIPSGAADRAGGCGAAGPVPCGAVGAARGRSGLQTGGVREVTPDRATARARHLAATGPPCPGAGGSRLDPDQVGAALRQPVAAPCNIPISRAFSP